MSEFSAFGRQLREVLLGLLEPSSSPTDPGMRPLVDFARSGPARPPGRQAFDFFAASDVRMRTVSPITIVFGEERPDPRTPLDQLNRPFEEVAFLGYIVIRRGNPVLRPDGRWEIPQQILEADTEGFSQTLGRRLRIIQHPDKRSLGKTIQKRSGTDFPADSFFNVHFQLSSTDGGEFPVLENATQVNVASAEIERLPPLFHGYAHRYEEEPVALTDQSGKAHAWFVAGMKIVHGIERQELLASDPFAGPAS